MRNRNKYARGNLHLMSRKEVYVPHITDSYSILVLADYIILAGLIHGKRTQRRNILRAIESKESSHYFHATQYEYFLFRRIVQRLAEDMNRKITPEMIVGPIFDFFSEVWGYTPKWREIRDTMYRCAQIYYMTPTPKQVRLAIEARKDLTFPRPPR